MTNLLTVPEVAERLRKSEAFVLRELRRNNMAGSRFGGAWHIADASVDAYIAAHLNVRPVERRRSA